MGPRGAGRLSHEARQLSGPESTYFPGVKLASS